MLGDVFCAPCIPVLISVPEIWLQSRCWHCQAPPIAFQRLLLFNKELIQPIAEQERKRWDFQAQREGEVSGGTFYRMLHRSEQLTDLAAFILLLLFLRQLSHQACNSLVWLDQQGLLSLLRKWACTTTPGFHVRSGDLVQSNLDASWANSPPHGLWFI